MNKKIYGLCAGILASATMAAQEQQTDSIQVQQLDEVVVSDSRFQLKRANSGKTVIKITAKELERSQGKSIAQLINSKSGLEIGGSRGRNGEILGVFGRGGRGRQVLVVIDGVQVTDPSSFSSEYDLRLLDLANIETIEIIKGAASTLYGPNAATAVINITTKKSSKRKIAGNFKSTVGTNQTSDDQNYNASSFDNSAQVSGSIGNFSYLAGVSNSYSNGISSITTPENQEDDFERFTTDVKLSYRFSKNFDITVYGNYTDLETSFDDAFAFADTDFEFLSEQQRVGLTANYNYTSGSVHLNTAFTDYESESVSAFPSTFAAKNYIADVYNKYNFNGNFYTILGLNVINNTAEFGDSEEFTIVDPYANVVYVSSFGLNVNAGARLNNHSEYGSNFVYNINPSFTFELEDGYFKILTSYATSYITPSLTQLFGDFGANPDLEPEDNTTYEGGLEFNKTGKVRASVLYFNRSEENLITFDENFVSVNSDSTIDAQGAEIEVDWTIVSDLNFGVNYTFTERKGDNAIRIPRHKINAALNYALSDRTELALNYAFNGERPDTDFGTFTDMDLPSFSLVDFYISHEIMPKKVKLFLNATNIFNAEFVEVIGFNTRGRNINLGINISL